MKRLPALALCFGLLLSAPLPAQTGLEGLLAQLVLPAISSVVNTVESVAISTTDLAGVWANADTFIKQNEDELLHDIARGKGEYLDALGDLLEVPKEARAAFQQDLKRRYLEVRAVQTGKG